MWRNSSRRSTSALVCRFSDRASGGGRGGGGGGRGGGGRGRGGGGRGREGGHGSASGRGQGNALERFREGANRPPKQHRGGPRKENFARKVLEPAAQGRLDNKHTSGIPRLAARKGKTTKLHDPFPGNEADEVLDLAFMKASGRHLEATHIRGGNGKQDTNTQNGGLAEALKLLHPEFVDDEDLYDEIETHGFDPDNHPDVTTDEEGNVILSYDPDTGFDDYEEGDDAEFIEEDGEDEQNGQNDNRADNENPEDMFFDRDIFDFEAPRPEDNVPEEIANMLLPLKIEGPGLDDFLEAHYDHPSKYAEVRRYNHHPEYLREPKPSFAKNRLQPTEEFVTSHQRFLYVSGLPHHVDDGVLGDFENPIHRLEVAKKVADMVGVKVESISPASMTSAFVGYKNKHDLYQFLKGGPKYSTFDQPVKMSLYKPTDGDEYGFALDDAVLKLEKAPAGVSDERLSRIIFPEDTELGKIYGGQTEEDIRRVDPTTVLVRMKSTESAESALASSLVIERMEKLGHIRVQFFRARRELRFAGFTGPNQCHTFKKKGMRLTVDCDAPPNGFFRSHAGVIQLRNVDESLTKEEISKHFAPFCVDRRDVYGSISFATCSQNRRTDICYVGFERYGEAEAVIEANRGLMNLGKGMVSLRLVRELFNPHAVAPRESRPERSTEELLETLNWRNFVDPKDLEELEAKGIQTETLADVFRVLRFNNESYGRLDWSMGREKLDPSSQPGQQMRETMKLYVDTLKEILDNDEEGISLAQALTRPDDEYEEPDTTGEDYVKDDMEKVASINQRRRSYFLES